MEQQLQEMIDNIAKTLNITNESLDKLIDETEDPAEKSGFEEVKNSSVFKLYNSVVTGILKMFRDPNVGECLRVVINRTFPNAGISNDAYLKSLTRLLLTVSLNASMISVLEYDKLLKEEMKAHDNELAEVINTALADINGIKLAIEHMKKSNTQT